MEFIDAVINVLSVKSLFVVGLGSVLGTVVGVLPGFGPINALALLMPICFSMSISVEATMTLLIAVYYGAMFGGSTTSILLNIPGEISSTVTCIDGYKLTKKGLAGRALSVAAWGSFFAGLIGIATYVVFAPKFSDIAVMFGPIEKSILILAVCILVVVMSESTWLKASIAFVLGGCISLIGLDSVTLVPRFTFSSLELQDGIDLVTLCIAAFAIPEAFFLAKISPNEDNNRIRQARVKLEWTPHQHSLGAMLRGGFLGSIVGMIPGLGASTASSLAYYSEKRLINSNTPETIALTRGVASPESANNSAVIAALLPTLVLGLPGSATSGLLLGAMQSLGLEAGPNFVSENQHLHLNLVASLLIVNILLLVLNLPFATFFAKAFLLPPKWLAAIIFSMSLMGWHFNNGRLFGLFILIVLSIFCIFLRRVGIPMVQILLGYILLGDLETMVRQAVQIYWNSE